MIKRTKSISSGYMGAASAACLEEPEDEDNPWGAISAERQAGISQLSEQSKRRHTACAEQQAEGRKSRAAPKAVECCVIF